MKTLCCALLMAIAACGAFAQTATEAADGKRRSIEQKIRLIETLINSPAAINAPYGRVA